MSLSDDIGPSKDILGKYKVIYRKLFPCLCIISTIDVRSTYLQPTHNEDHKTETK